MKPSPRPWRAKGGIIIDKNNETVAYTHESINKKAAEMDANTELIVKCVNRYVWEREQEE